MNEVYISGNIATDIRGFQTESGKQGANFGIMVQSPFSHEESNYFNCVAYGGKANYLLTYFKKGSQLVCRGGLISKKQVVKDTDISYVNVNILINDITTIYPAVKKVEGGDDDKSSIDTDGIEINGNEINIDAEDLPF